MTMPPPVRKSALATHLACSVGWLGAVAAYLALDLTVATSENALLVRGAWMAMDRVVSLVIVPVAVASILTGLLMSLATRWGLFRHWWVLVSLALTVFATFVLWSGADVISRMAYIAADPTTSDDAVLALPPTLGRSIGGLIVLLLIQVLNVYKPRGLTRYGWRKQQEERHQRRMRRETASSP